MSEHIDTHVDPTLAGPLPQDHPARRHAAELPDWHPVRRLFTGASQWLGRIDAVYAFLRLFCTVYDDYIWPVQGSDADAREEFLRHFPKDVVFQGRRYDLHRLHAKARGEIRSPAALAAFDRTFSLLVRTVRSS